jgi:hypothetical protein
MARGNGYKHDITSPSSHRIGGTMSVTRPHYPSEQAHQSSFSARNMSVNMYALPLEDRAEALIREYFQKTGQLLPFIHEQSFYDTYFQMKHTNFTMARRTWLGLLNIIFAMATTLSVNGYGSAEERIEKSDIFYQRANALCDKESKRNISLELGPCHPIIIQDHTDIASSPVPPHPWAVPSRNAKTCAGMDCAWTRYNDSLTTRLTLTEVQLWVSSPRSGDAETSMVWLCSSRSVRGIT